MKKAENEEKLERFVEESAEEEFIEVWAREKKIDAALIAGVMELKGWREGRKVSKANLDSALRQFLGLRAG